MLQIPLNPISPHCVGLYSLPMPALKVSVLNEIFPKWNRGESVPSCSVGVCFFCFSAQGRGPDISELQLYFKNKLGMIFCNKVRLNRKRLWERLFAYRTSLVSRVVLA